MRKSDPIAQPPFEGAFLAKKLARKQNLRKKAVDFTQTPDLLSMMVVFLARLPGAHVRHTSTLPPKIRKSLAAKPRGVRHWADG